MRLAAMLGCATGIVALEVAGQLLGLGGGHQAAVDEILAEALLVATLVVEQGLDLAGREQAKFHRLAAETAAGNAMAENPADLLLGQPPPLAGDDTQCRSLAALPDQGFDQVTVVDLAAVVEINAEFYWQRRDACRVGRGRGAGWSGRVVRPLTGERSG